MYNQGELVTIRMVISKAANTNLNIAATKLKLTSAQLLELIAQTEFLDTVVDQVNRELTLSGITK